MLESKSKITSFLIPEKINVVAGSSEKKIYPIGSRLLLKPFHCRWFNCCVVFFALLLPRLSTRYLTKKRCFILPCCVLFYWITWSSTMKKKNSWCLNFTLIYMILTVAILIIFIGHESKPSNMQTQMEWNTTTVKNKNGSFLVRRNLINSAIILLRFCSYS